MYFISLEISSALSSILINLREIWFSSLFKLSYKLNSVSICSLKKSVFLAPFLCESFMSLTRCKGQWEMHLCLIHVHAITGRNHCHQCNRFMRIISWCVNFLEAFLQQNSFPLANRERERETRTQQHSLFNITPGVLLIFHFLVLLPVRLLSICFNHKHYAVTFYQGCSTDCEECK